MIRVGLLGHGLAGRVFHAPLIGAVPQLVLQAIGGSGDAPAIIADPRIDLIVVATPNATHYALAQAALAAGKHVVVDKPFVTSVGQADRLIDLAARQQRLLTVFHNRRWDGDFLTVCDVLGSGRLGQWMLYEAHWDRFRPASGPRWKDRPAEGSGTLWDLAPHLIDQMLLLFGLPEAVQADIAAQRPAAEVDDYFALTFHYGEKRALLSASNLVAAPRPRFSLHGTGGTFVKSGLDPQEVALGSGSHPSAAGFGLDKPSSYGQLIVAGQQAEAVTTRAGRYLSFYEQVAAALLAGTAPPVDPGDAKTGVRLIEAARDSARSGRRIAL